MSRRVGACLRIGTWGRIILAGDDELEPVPSRILSYNDNTGISIIQLLLGTTHSTVA